MFERWRLPFLFLCGLAWVFQIPRNFWDVSFISIWKCLDIWITYTFKRRWWWVLRVSWSALQSKDERPEKLLPQHAPSFCWKFGPESPGAALSLAFRDLKKRYLVTEAHWKLQGRNSHENHTQEQELQSRFFCPRLMKLCLEFALLCFAASP